MGEFAQQMGHAVDPNRTQRAYWQDRHHARGYAHPAVKVFAQQRIAYLRQHLPWADIHTAVDVGCGDGFVGYYAAQALPRLYAGDRSRGMLAHHPLAGRLTQFDALALPFAAGTFDLAFACELLHHIADPRDVVRELARVSSRYVVLFEPNRNHPLQFLLALLKPSERWTLRFSLAYMTEVAAAADLEVVRADVVGWIFPKRVPAVLLPLLERLPFRCPPFGITNVLICRKTGT